MSFLPAVRELNPGNRLKTERFLWKHGYGCLAGVDEAGRGALAGPLVAGAVAITPDISRSRQILSKLYRDVKDSKTLSANRRAEALGLIRDAFVAVGVGVVQSQELDLIGLSAANRIAMERAVEALAMRPEFLLLDAFTVESPLPQCGLIDGDNRVLSIAAASIVAKVERDEMMRACEDRFPQFSFARHKGYGTALHLDELRSHGPCELHRRSFRPVRCILSRS